MIGLMLAAFMAPPHAPPVDQRLTDIENRLAAVETKLGIATPAPAAVATPQPSPVMQQVSATEFSPTWHYAPGTTLVQDANGVLVPSQAATHISYPGQPMQVAPPPQFYAPPPMQMRGGPFRGFFRGRGSVCVGGNCG